jgi:hypothetical protein
MATNVARKRQDAIPPRRIPLDDEPLTPADLRAMRRAEEEIRRGEYCTLDELETNVARLRSQLRAKGARARSRR